MCKCKTLSRLIAPVTILTFPAVKRRRAARSRAGRNGSPGHPPAWRHPGQHALATPARQERDGQPGQPPPEHRPGCQRLERRGGWPGRRRLRVMLNGTSHLEPVHGEACPDNVRMNDDARQIVHSETWAGVRSPSTPPIFWRRSRAADFPPAFPAAIASPAIGARWRARCGMCERSQCCSVMKCYALPWHDRWPYRTSRDLWEHAGPRD